MIAFIGMGGNVADPRKSLRKALTQLGKSFKIKKKSSLYRTEPVGGPIDQPDCYNAVIKVEVKGDPTDTLDELIEIELRMGRNRSEKWGPRIIDLDLLDQGGLILVEDDIMIPHPMMHMRAFVLEPLREIAPRWKHPTFGLTPKKMLEQLEPEDRSVILEVENWP